MNREQIINQYISVYEGRAMEKEELEIMLNGFADDIVNNLQRSLPGDLDEAAEDFVWEIMENDEDGVSDLCRKLNYLNKITDFYDGLAEFFKAGARWAMQQLKGE